MRTLFHIYLIPKLLMKTYGIRIKAVKLCENECEVGTISRISQSFPYWYERLLHADEGWTDSGGTTRPCLTPGKETMSLTGFLLPGWVSITQLPAVNPTNQRQEEDIPSGARRAATDRQPPCQARWSVDEEWGLLLSRPTVHPPLHPSPYPLPSQWRH